MTRIILHRNATTNMKTYFYGYLVTKQFGTIDTVDHRNNVIKQQNRKLVSQYKSTSSVDSDLELQKLRMINIMDEQILYDQTPDPDVTVITTLRAAIVNELDSGVKTYYSTYSYKLRPPTGVW